MTSGKGGGALAGSQPNGGPLTWSLLNPKRPSWAIIDTLLGEQRLDGCFDLLAEFDCC